MKLVINNSFFRELDDFFLRSTYMGILKRDEV